MTGWAGGGEAGSARGSSWYTDRCAAEGIALRFLAAGDLTNCLSSLPRPSCVGSREALMHRVETNALGSRNVWRHDAYIPCDLERSVE